MNLKVVPAMVAGLFLIAAVPSFSHHSFVMFETSKRIELTGKVTAFEWTNPHAYIEIDVPDGDQTKHWSVELGSPSILMQSGWKHRSLKAGDKVTVVINPLKNGDPGGLLIYATLPDGQSLGNGPGRGPGQGKGKGKGGSKGK